MNRHKAPVLATAFVAVMLFHGCGYEPTPVQPLPQGGAEVTAGPLRLDDVWVDAARGVAAGGDAPLRLAITNDSTHPDTLVGVSTPVADQVVLERHGEPVRRLNVPPGTITDLERSDSVVLQHVRTPLHVGEWFPVTFDFARAGEVTLSITVGPLGNPATATTNPTPTTPEHGGAS